MVGQFIQTRQELTIGTRTLLGLSLFNRYRHHQQADGVRSGFPCTDNAPGNAKMASGAASKLRAAWYRQSGLFRQAVSAQSGGLREIKVIVQRMEKKGAGLQ